MAEKQNDLSEKPGVCIKSISKEKGGYTALVQSPEGKYGRTVDLQPKGIPTLSKEQLLENLKKAGIKPCNDRDPADRLLNDLNNLLP